MARATRATRLSGSYRIDDGDKFRLKDHDPADSGDLKKTDSDDLLEAALARLSEVQVKLYAEHQWSLLLILQGLDASGKDSVIKHIAAGLNPLGCHAHAYRAPSAEERDHDFLWRHVRDLPQRGGIEIFNRSYYEEVLIVRVHPELLESEGLPPALITDDIWDQRFADIRAFERHLANSGTVVRKFFLNVSKQEQRKRFLERLDRPDKNWKFNADDLKQRERWDDYIHAYEQVVRNTSTADVPWYIVPADKKWFARLVVADAVIEALEEMDLDYPKLDDDKRRQLEEARRIVEAEKD